MGLVKGSAWGGGLGQVSARGAEIGQSFRRCRRIGYTFCIYEKVRLSAGVSEIDQESLQKWEWLVKLSAEVNKNSQVSAEVDRIGQQYLSE